MSVSSTFGRSGYGISDVESLALVMDDLDAPDGHFIHWLAWNIPPVKRLREARLWQYNSVIQT